MKTLVKFCYAYVLTRIRSRRSMQMEILALRHQLSVYQRSGRCPRVIAADRFIWSWIARRWHQWREVLIFVQPKTVIGWQRKRFRNHWAQLIAQGQPGRPAIAKEVRVLIGKISKANPSWGSPRIAGKLRKLDIHVAKSTVEKYRIRPSKPSSPSWRTFLDNHLKDLVSIDFLVVPTIEFKVLFVLVVLAHHRRKIVYFNVTQHPTSEWTGQQLVEAFPWNKPPKYLIRDRDKIYGTVFRRRVHTLGIEEVLTAPYSPWQNPFVERVIGSIRRECLDHVIVLNEGHLTRVLTDYFAYYHRWCTHLSLTMDAPESRPVHRQEFGRVVEYPNVGGLHHYYERIAA